MVVRSRTAIVTIAMIMIIACLCSFFQPTAFAATDAAADIPDEGDAASVEEEPLGGPDALTQWEDPDDQDVGHPQIDAISTEVYGGDFSSADDFDVWWSTDEYVPGSSAMQIDEVDGNPCAQIVSTEPNDARLEQYIDVSPESVYRIRVKAMAQGVVSDGEFGANIGIRGIVAGSRSVFDTDGKWEELELYVQTGENQYALAISLCLGGYGSLATGTAWFDDVTIEEVAVVPEGATLVYVSAEPDSAVEIPEEDETAYDASVTTRNLLLIVLFALLLSYGVYALFRKLCVMQGDKPLGKDGKTYYIVAFLGFAFVLRLALAAATPGHPTDINCFSAWAELAFEHGFNRFYTAGFFADYPPGYMYVLYIIGAIKKLFAIQSAALYIALVKLPAIIADLTAAWLVYRYAEKKGRHTIALAIMTVIAFNPTAILVSSVWGQIDSILTLALIAVYVLIDQKKMILAAAVYGAAVLLKPQALMAGPVFALPYLFELFENENKAAAWKTLALSALSAFGVIILGALPFQGSQEPLWLIDKYAGTINSYPYASIHAFNLFSLFGGNWVEQTTKVGPLTYEQWGMIGIAWSLIMTLLFALRSRKNGRFSLSLLTAFLLCSLFTLSHNMHERYAFPALFLLCVAYVELKDIRILRALGMLTASMFINVASVLLVSQTPAETAAEFLRLTRFASAFSVGAFGYLVYVCYSIMSRGNIVEESFRRTPMARKNTVGALLATQPIHSPRLTKRDWWIMCALTGVYALVAFVNLGTTKVPTSYWLGSEEGQVITVNFGKVQNVSSVWSYGGISDATVAVNAVDEDGAITKAGDVPINYDVMFRWNVTDLSFAASQVVIDTTKGTPWINELAFMDQDGKPIPVQSVQVTGPASSDKDSAIEHVFDEQSMIPDRPSRYNGMYFDELYHARTALEHLKGLEPYENSHPPLGKIFIMVGILLFGMTPFGWRFAGTLFGVGMVPIMYLFAKRFFKRTDLALFVSFMMTFDFMHFVQTRIATIDVFGVFFIILMYYFMYRYYEMNFFVDGLKRTLVPLGLCGLFFALGVASKWIGIYAGGGLAVLLFISLFKRLAEYRAARRAAAEGEEGAQKAVELTKNYWRCFVITGAFCIGFFIVLPIGVYLLSYLPYILCKAKPYDLAGIWDVQKFMYNYHSALTATHPFESKWFTWPVMAKPIWYYKGDHLPEGMVEGIFALGNPAVWWSGFVGLIILLVGRMDKTFTDRRAGFLLIGFAAQFLPWTLITRATFIYHYFASVPFIIFALAFVLEQFEKIGKNAWIKYALMGAALVLFILFYPSLSGTPIPIGYAKLLKWFPTWIFY